MRTYKVSPLPGGGPWRILRDCPSLLHNTYRAVNRGHPDMRCRCPRGRVVRETEQDRRRTYKASVIHSPAVSLAANRRMPDLSAGLCRTPAGLDLIDAAAVSTANRAAGATAKVKAMCRRCPVRTACLEWALADPEFTADGIYGGYDAYERRKMIEKGEATA